MKLEIKKEWQRIVVYLIGLLILALGLTLNTKANLGVSPIISIPFTISLVTGVNFALLTFGEYVIFVIIQLLIERKIWDTKILLQMPLSVCFAYIMDVFDHILPEINSNILIKMIVLLIAIICIGIGAALSVNMDIVANPGDAIVKSIADVSHRKMGNVKNFFDLACVLISLMIAFAFLHSLGGVGIGTLVAVVGVGRVIYIVSNMCHYRKTSKDNAYPV